MKLSQGFVKMLVLVIVVLNSVLSVSGASYKVDKNNAANHDLNHPVDLTSDTDDIEVEVHEQPSTGWFWQCSFDATIFEITSDEYTTHTSPFPIGGEWARSMKMIGKKPTSASVPVVCALGRHWQNDRPATDRFLFFVHVQTPHKPLANKVKPQEAEEQVKVKDSEAPPTNKMSAQSVYDPRNEPNFPPIRDQGQCGSCWAFGTVGQLEVMWALKCNTETAPLDVSEQFLVSCNRNGYSCRYGGFWSHQYHFDTLGFVQTAYGSVPEADFPYAAQDLPCRIAYPHDVKLDSSTIYFTATNENIMANVLQYGAVGTYICMNNALSYWYPTPTTPFFNGQDCTSTNHAVVIVGFDSVQRYWIIRNSWGPGWGANGYMYIAWDKSGVGDGVNYVQFSDCPLPAPAGPKCSEYTCPQNYLLKPNPASIACTDTCTTDLCCDAKDTCVDFHCPASQPVLRSTVVCATTVCTTNECCAKRKK